MKASELNLEKNSFTLSCNTFPARSHYKEIMVLGRSFPSTKSQAKFFVGKRIILDVLNIRDVEVVESLLNKHGFNGDYRYTKSNRWATLCNHESLYKALTLEFAL